MLLLRPPHSHTPNSNHSPTPSLPRYCAGGELFHWLKAHKLFSETRSKLYGAEIALALDTMHQHDIIYRDLKPENLLLGEDGHVKVTDFGLAKDHVKGDGAEEGTNTFCGTPEYLAPEILNSKGHGKAVDWWSFGTLLWEMMCGLPPFYDKNVQRMYNKILYQDITFPTNDNIKLSPDAKDLLTKLLERDVESRLGSGPTGGTDIAQHAFFAELDMAKVLAREYTPEFLPPKGAESAANFDAEFTDEKAAISLAPASALAGKDANAFEGFTYMPGAAGLNG